MAQGCRSIGWWSLSAARVAHQTDRARKKPSLTSSRSQGCGGWWCFRLFQRFCTNCWINTAKQTVEGRGSLTSVLQLADLGYGFILQYTGKIYHLIYINRSSFAYTRGKTVRSCLCSPLSLTQSCDWRTSTSCLKHHAIPEASGIFTEISIALK